MEAIIYTLNWRTPQLPIMGKEKFLLPNSTHFFYKLDRCVHYRLFPMSADEVFWNKCSPDVPTSFAAIVHIISDKNAAGQEIFVVVTSFVHGMRLIFRLKYKLKLVQSWKRPVVPVLLEAIMNNCMAGTDIISSEKHCICASPPRCLSMRTPYW